MSTQSPDSAPETLSVFDLFKLWYHIPVLLIAAVSMFSIRLAGSQRFITDNGVFLSGTDAWYHLRAIEWSVENWPQTIPYDVYSAFPTGASHGEFGTIYDLVIATVAFIIGLGDPSQQTIALTLLYTPAVLGTLIIFPVYYLAAKIAGRGAGLVSAVLLAAMPGVFLERGLVGYASHNIAEVLLMVLAVTFIFLAIRSIPQQSHLTDFLYSSSGTFDGAVKYSVFAGAFTALYLMVWPAGIAFLGFFAAFIAFRILSDTASRTPLELISIPGVVIPFTTGAVLLPVIVGNTVLYSAPLLSLTELSFLHAIAASLAAGLPVIATLYTHLYSHRHSGQTSLIHLLALFASVFLGFSIFAAQTGQFLSYLLTLFGFGVVPGLTPDTQALWALASPKYGFSASDVLVREYGFAFVAAGVGILISAFKMFRRESSADVEFLTAWAVFTSALAFTQMRFQYYLAVAVAIFTGYFLYHLAGSITDWFSSADRVSDSMSLPAVIVAVVVTVLLFAPLIAPLPLANAGGQAVTSTNVIESANANSPGEVTEWQEPLTYLQENTPSPSESNAELPYNGTYSHTTDYEYPSDAYGVLSWSSYGHWITTLADRPSVATPEQNGVQETADFLVGDDPDALPAQDNGAEAKYVMADWKTADANQVLGDAAAHSDVRNKDDLVTPVYSVSNGSFQQAYSHKEQAYYESMAVRLYHLHGSSLDKGNIAVEYSERTASSGESVKVFEGPGDIHRFNSSEEAQAFADKNPNAEVGGIGMAPNERVSALEQYRLVNSSYSMAFNDRQYMQSVQQTIFTTGYDKLQVTQPSWVKTFEKVDGATIEGDAPAGSTVEASVNLSEGARSNFTYTKQAEVGEDGTFEMTVPYGTTGYDSVTTEDGYTETSVTADGPYTISIIGGGQGGESTVHVPESNVVGEDSEPVTVSVLESGQLANQSA